MTGTANGDNSPTLTKKADSGGRQNRHLDVSHYRGEFNVTGEGIGTPDGNGIFSESNDNGEWLADTVNLNKNVKLKLNAGLSTTFSISNQSNADAVRALHEFGSNRFVTKTFNDTLEIDTTAEFGNGNGTIFYQTESQDGKEVARTFMNKGTILNRIEETNTPNGRKASFEMTTVNGFRMYFYDDVSALPKANIQLNDTFAEIGVENTASDGCSVYIEGEEIDLRFGNASELKLDSVALGDGGMIVGRQSLPPQIVKIETVLDAVILKRSHADNTAATNAGLIAGNGYYNTTTATFTAVI